MFAHLEPAKLRIAANALYRFAQAALGSHRSLILTPSSPRAKTFGIQLGTMGECLEDQRDKPRTLERLAEELAENVGQFADWQNTEYDRLITDFAGSLEKIVSALSSTVTENEQIGSDMARVAENLRNAGSCDSIEEMRSNLSQQAASLHHVVKQQAAMQVHIKREYEATVKVLASQLQMAESRGRTDSLTKMPNRGAFEQELQTALARFRQGDGEYSLAITDLDMFKAINDTLGHPAGDACLIAFAQLLKESFDGIAFSARLGGDEFVVLFKGAGDDLTQRLRKLQSDLRKRPVYYDATDRSHKAVLACSFGVTDVQEGDNPSTVYKRADTNLYEMKRIQRGERADKAA